MDKNEVKSWKCANGHILGKVIRNGGGIRQLMLYRNAQVEDTPDMAEIMALVEGLVVDVRCDVSGCNSIRTWVPGQESLDRLLAQARRAR